MVKDIAENNLPHWTEVDRKGEGLSLYLTLHKNENSAEAKTAKIKFSTIKQQAT